VIEAKLYEYTAPLKNGILRKGLYLCATDTIVEIAPLPGYSKETFETVKQECKSLFTHEKNNPFSPSVAFALSCLFQKKGSLRGIEQCALLRSTHELDHKKGYKRYKLKVKNLSLSEAISFTSKVYEQTGTPLRIDCNQSWNAEKTTSFLTYFSNDIIEYIEEPTPSLDDNLLLTKTTSHNVALDESLITLPFEQLQDVASSFVFILKPTLIGPLDRFLTLDAQKFVLSSAFETGAGTRHLLNQIHQSDRIDPYVGWDTYSDILSDPIDPPCSGEISWNVQLKNGLTLLLQGPLLLGKAEPTPTTPFTSS